MKNEIVIGYKDLSIIHDEEQDIDIETEVELLKNSTLNELANEEYKYTYIKLTVANTSEMDSCSGFEITFSSSTFDEVNFTFAISNGTSDIYSEEITIRNTSDSLNPYTFFNDKIGIALNEGDNIFFKFYNLEEKIKVSNIIVLGKDRDEEYEDLYDDDYFDNLDDETNNEGE